MKKLIHDLCKAPDGSWSITKMAAVTAHAMLAFSFAKITLAVGFLPDMWLIYGGFAFTHAVVDKTAAQIKAFKERVLDKEPDVQRPAPQDPAV